MANMELQAPDRERRKKKNEKKREKKKKPSWDKRNQLKASFPVIFLSSLAMLGKQLYPFYFIKLLQEGKIVISPPDP